MQKMDGKSLDLVGEIKAELVAALGKVVPEVVSEGEVDLEKLALILGKDKDLSDKLERYNFTWPDKRKAIKLGLTPSSGTLRPAVKESVNWDSTQNLYIEGDNLEVLKLLQKSYFGKIKMIYIDPPYNTGKEFVYPDDYADNIQNYLELTGQINESGRRITSNTETSGRYHTNWLNMMYPRLKLARNLLKEDGVIFISIDDNEVSNLRKICDEIFGEENFVTNFIWEKGKEGGNDSSLMRSHYDYVMCYCKNIDIPNIINLDTKDISRHIKSLPEPNMVSGVIKEINNGELFQLINLSKQKDYKVKITLTDNTILEWPSYAPQKTINEWIADGKIFVGKNKVPYVKSFLKDELQGQKPSNIITQKFGTTKAGSIEIRDFFGSRTLFPYPKPSTLIKRLSQIGSSTNSIILDFFSGSATTAHAVMELNKEDGGNRQFIMVQLPEPCDEASEAFKAGYKNICEIGKERIRRVIKKIESELDQKQKSSEGELDLGDAPASQKLDFGFKVFKLDSSNFIAWDNNPDNFSEESLQASLSNIKLDRSQQDLLYELFLKLGVTLNTPYQKVQLAGKNMYDIGFGTIYACLDEDLNMDFCNAMISYHDNQFPKEESKDKKEERELERYRLETTTFIFRDTSFADDNIKTNILQTLRQMGLENIRAI